jgi:hypothetical protein
MRCSLENFDADLEKLGLEGKGNMTTLLHEMARKITRIAEAFEECKGSTPTTQIPVLIEERK